MDVIKSILSQIVEADEAAKNKMEKFRKTLFEREKWYKQNKSKVMKEMVIAIEKCADALLEKLYNTLKLEQRDLTCHGPTLTEIRPFISPTILNKLDEYKIELSEALMGYRTNEYSWKIRKYIADYLRKRVLNIPRITQNLISLP